MLKYTFIKNLTAGFLLALLAFSATPKITLHWIISNHKEATVKSGDVNTCQLSTAGFNCKCDNLVVDAPFFYKLNLITFIVPASFNLKSIPDEYQVYSTGHFIFRLRGPPYQI